MSGETYYGLGYKGELFAILTYEEILEYDAHVKLTKKGHTVLPSQMISDISRSGHIIEAKKGSTIDDLFPFVSEHYENSSVFGPYGDVIELTKVETQNSDVYVAKIGRKDMITHTAADLAIFVKGKDENANDVVYAVTGIRNNDPGKGLLATIGGLCNCTSNVLDSPFYTIVHEASEEAGLRINCPELEQLKENYNITEKEVTVSLGNDEIQSKIFLIGTYPTTKVEEFKGTGRKRVYAATAYMINIDLKDRLVDKTLLNDYFNAGDDIGKLGFIDITDAIKIGDFSKVPRLAFTHHDIIMKNSILKAREIYGGLR